MADPKPDTMAYYKHDEVLNVDYTPPAGDWRDIKYDPEFYKKRAGSWIYTTKKQHIEYLGMPHPHDWAPQEEDWGLPENWKEIIFKGIRERLDKFRVMIKDHHEAYITWKEFIEHQVMLDKNQTNKEETMLSGPAREGLALLQGLLLCSKCGRKITVRYKGNGGIYPTYECNWLRKEGMVTAACLSIRCDLIDDVIVKRALEVLEPAQIEIAMNAVMELEKRNETISNQMFRDGGVANVSSHSLRRTHANTLRRNGTDLMVIKEQLGHSSLSTTQRYFKADPIEVQNAVDGLKF